MARTAEKVSINSLSVILDSAKASLEKSKQVQEIAKRLEKLDKEAYNMLMDSVRMHREEYFKAVRKVQVKVVNELVEQNCDLGGAMKLIELAKVMGLFPEFYEGEGKPVVVVKEED